jgi:general secretion pathway protein K
MKSRKGQGGVAVVTALLVTALAVTLVSGMFWEQQVFVRTVEGQQQRLQASLLSRSALDELRVVLRDKGVARWDLPPGGAMSGHVIDAQSRFNLRNLNGNPFQLAAFARLLAVLKLDAALAPAIAAAVQGGSVQLAIRSCDDLLAVPGIAPDAVARLRDFVTVLPEPTAVNVNTASAEVLTTVARLSLAEAREVVVRRDHLAFRDAADFAFRLNDKETLEGVQFQVLSDYFLVSGTVQVDRVSLRTLALMRRRGEHAAALLWIGRP